MTLDLIHLQQLIYESDVVNESRGSSVRRAIPEEYDMAFVSALLTMLSVVARRWFNKGFRKRRNCSCRKGWATRWERSHTWTRLKAMRQFLLFMGLDSLEPEQ